MIAIILNRFDLCNRGKKSTLSCRQVSAIEIFYDKLVICGNSEPIYQSKNNQIRQYYCLQQLSIVILLVITSLMIIPLKVKVVMRRGNIMKYQKYLNRSCKIPKIFIHMGCVLSQRKQQTDQVLQPLNLLSNFKKYCHSRMNQIKLVLLMKKMDNVIENTFLYIFSSLLLLEIDSYIFA